MQETAQDSNQTPMEKLIGEAQELADRMEKWAEGYKENPGKPSEVAGHLLKAKDGHAELDKAIKRIYHVKDMLEKYLMPKVLEDEGLDKISVPELGKTFASQTKTSASFWDKEKGYAWLRENGHEDMIQETVNAGTLSAFVRNMMINEGIDPPEDIVKVSTYNTTGITKYTPKKK